MLGRSPPIPRPLDTSPNPCSLSLFPPCRYQPPFHPFSRLSPVISPRPRFVAYSYRRLFPRKVPPPGSPLPPSSYWEKEPPHPSFSSRRLPLTSHSCPITLPDGVKFS